MHQHITLLCHKKKEAPHEIRRGSATADDQYAYITPWGSRLVYRYEWSTEKWDQLPLPPYWNSGLVIINGELNVVGGSDGSCTNKVVKIQQGQWVEYYPPMNISRSFPAVVSTPDGNYILVIGGEVAVNSWTSAVELFHVRSRTWYRLTNLPKHLIRPSATICGNPIHVHVIGLDGTGYSCSLQALLSSDQPIVSQSISRIFTWTQLPQLPVKESTAATLCGQLVIVGGWQGVLPVSSIHQLLDGQWVKIGSMSSSRRRRLVVSPLPDKMMIVGGVGGDSVEECVVV